MSLLSASTVNSKSFAFSTPEASTLNQVRLRSILGVLTPITLENCDIQGRKIRIWRYRNTFVGAIFTKTGHLSVVPASHIHNGISPKEAAFSFLNRVAAAPAKRWEFVVSSHLHIHIWPHLAAAGRPDEHWTPPTMTTNRSQRGHMFKNEQGHFKKDTPKNIAIIARACAAKENYAGTDVHGNDIYFAKNPDGSQSWARVRNGVITEGGANLPGEHARFNRHLGTVVTLFEEKRAKVNDRIKAYAREIFRGIGSRVFTPSLGHFRQLLQQTNLVKSYNSVHPHNPMVNKGTISGQIGGVACSTSYLKGLFEGPEALFEEDHFFAFPTLPNGQLPFTSAELQQILRELAVGIYVYSTVPFFSLHFREEGSDLFPVIHPVYEHTLVGRVISMLDYIMKGYLNGGVYKEEFIDSWHLRPDWESRESSALEELIDFESYCKEHMSGVDQEYTSLANLEAMLESYIRWDSSIPEDLRSFKGFKNSFRIIAKQNSIQKEGNLFTIDADFDVFYDINPSSEYTLALEEYTREHGRLPSSHVQIEELYKLEATRIHDHMSKMPLCQKYFSLLFTINFFASYFSTLKKHRKVPSLPSMKIALSNGCPQLFPHLPVLLHRREEITCNFHQVLQNIMLHHRNELIGYFNGVFSHILDKKQGEYKPEEKVHLVQLFKEGFKSHLLESFSAPVSRFFRSRIENLEQQQDVVQLLENLIIFFVNGTNGLVTEWERMGYSVERIRENQTFLQEIVQDILNEFLGTIPDESQSLGQFSAPLTFLPHEIPSSTRKKISRVVGGCGLQLQEQQMQSSLLAETLLNSNMGTLLSTPPEILTVIQDGFGNPRALFRLYNEDLPVQFIDDYRWMEETLLSPPNEREKINARLEITMQ